MRKTKGFTLVELLVVVAIIALLISILLPTLGRAREIARQTMCMSNLKNIGTSCAMYHADYNGQWPILPDAVQATAEPYYTAALQFGGDATVAALGAGAQQNLNLLVKSGSVAFQMFICPSSGKNQKGNRDANSRFGFGDGTAANHHIDYAIQIPYRGPLSGSLDSNRCPLTPDMDPGVAILGDQGPRLPADVQTQWSDNHKEDGESLVYAGLNVRFSKDKRTIGSTTTVNAGGWGGNNVYAVDTWTGTEPNITVSGYTTTVGYPPSSKDTVLHAYRP